LREHSRLGQFLETPAPALLGSADQEDEGKFQQPSGSDGLERRVLGDYRIVREIGCGGMGVVYEAEQVSLGRRVALKVLPFAAILDPRRLQRFNNEAHAAASLKHPNIVRIYSVGCDRGVHYYAMEHIEGRTLAQVIVELRGLSAAAPANERQPAISQITADLLSGGKAAGEDRPSDEPAPTEPVAAAQGEGTECAHVGPSLRDGQRVSEIL
jgi:serine/threonine protein kinase